MAILYRIIGKSNIWLFALEMQLARFVLVVLSTVWKEARMHALLQPKWRAFILAIRECLNELKLFMP